MIRRAGGPGNVPEIKTSLPGNTVLRASMENLLWEKLLHLVGTRAKLAGEMELNAQKCFQHDFVPPCIRSDCVRPLLTTHSQRNKDQYCHENQLHTTLVVSHYAEDAGEVHVGCLEPSSDSSVYLRSKTHESETHLTLAMCSLCRYCFSPSPKIHYLTLVGKPCSVH